MTKIKEEGLEVSDEGSDFQIMTSSQTRRRAPDVTVSAELKRKVGECHEKVLAHTDRLQGYLAWIQVLEAHPDHVLPLQHNDWLYFFGNWAPFRRATPVLSNPFQRRTRLLPWQRRPPMPPPRAAKFSADWTCTNEAMPCYQWGKRAAAWKGGKGWWASREGHEGIQGPFRTRNQAQAWAVAPWREEHEAKAAVKAEVVAEKAAAEKAKADATWAGLPEEERKVASGQVWALRDGRMAGYEILVLEVNRAIAAVLTRRSQSEPWKDAPRTVRSLSTLPRLYRLVGTAKVPKGK